MILHLTTRGAWDEALHVGEPRAALLDAEGFIHCCTEAQLPGGLQRFFLGKSGLVALVVDPARLGSEVQWEPPVEATGRGERFPQVYGVIKTAAVVVARAIYMA